jgi:ribonuclease HI
MITPTTITTTALRSLRIPTGIKNKLIPKTNESKIYPICEYTLNFDGCSKGNPGYAGIGIVIYKNSEEIYSSAKFIGIKTNNQSEYSALIFGLEEALKMGINTISILGDSLLVINQINGIYKVKTDTLVELNKEAMELKKQFKYIEFNHVLREKNRRADELSNIALLNITTKNIAAVVDDFEIKDLNEDWGEEEKLDEITVSRMKSPNTRSNEKNKPTKLINSFFPTIKPKIN